MTTSGVKSLFITYAGVEIYNYGHIQPSNNKFINAILGGYT